MKKVLKHNGFDDLYVIERESPDSDRCTVRKFLSDSSFDINLDESIKEGVVSEINKLEFDEYIKDILVFIEEIYKNESKEMIIKTKSSNVVLVKENASSSNVKSLFAFSQDSDVCSKLSDKFVTLSKIDLMKMIADEYAYIIELPSNVNIYAAFYKGLYIGVLENKETVRLCSFEDYDMYCSLISKNAEEEARKYVIELFRTNVDVLRSYGYSMVDDDKDLKEAKNDRLDDKLRWELLPMEEIEDIVKVFHYGAKKYAPNAWKNIPDGFERCRAALMRHMMEYIKGNRIDQESGLQHLAQVCWNAIALLYYDKHGMGRFPNITSDPNEGCQGPNERSKSFRKK